MNSRFITYFVSVWMLTGALSVFAVVHKVDRWVKKSEDGKGEQTVTCFSVLEYDKATQEITEKEREDIVHAACAKNAFVIVTDNTVIDDGKNKLQKAHDICVRFQNINFKNYKESAYRYTGEKWQIVDTSSLSGLTHACKEHNVDCCNVEFRQFLYDKHKVRPKIDGDEESPSMSSQLLARPKINRDAPITLADVANTLQKVRKEVSEYNAAIKNDSRDRFINLAIEDAVLRRGACFYEDFIEYMRSAVKKIVLNHEHDQKVTAAGQHVNGLNASQKHIDADKGTAHYKALFNYWIAARVTDRVAAAANNYKNIFVCIAHEDIENVSQGLQALGYTKERSEGHDVRCSTEEDIRNAIKEQSIDIADYFDLDTIMEEPAPVLAQPKRFSYWHLLCATAVLATLSYLGYYYWRQPGVACRA